MVEEDSDEELIEDESEEFEGEEDKHEEDESPIATDEFLLCVDPSTLKHFRINLTKNYFSFEEIENEDLKKTITEKI